MERIVKIKVYFLEIFVTFHWIMDIIIENSKILIKIIEFEKELLGELSNILLMYSYVLNTRTQTRIGVELIMVFFKYGLVSLSRLEITYAYEPDIEHGKSL